MSADQPTPGAAGAGADDAIDRQTLAQLEQLDPTGTHQIVRRVLETYERSLLKCMGEFETARHQGDLPTVGRLAHTLRSSSASVGALALSALCRQVEAGVRDGLTDGAGTPLHGLMDSLQSESVRVRAALEVMLDRKGSLP